MILYSKYQNRLCPSQFSYCNTKMQHNICKLAELKICLYFLRSVCSGDHLEINRLQSLISSQYRDDLMNTSEVSPVVHLIFCRQTGTPLIGKMLVLIISNKDMANLKVFLNKATALLFCSWSLFTSKSGRFLFKICRLNGVYLFIFLTKILHNLCVFERQLVVVATLNWVNSRSQLVADYFL